jgi:hypothetical protein
MAVTFQKCPLDVMETIRRVMHEQHDRLEENAVKVVAIFANAGTDSKGIGKPAVKLHGKPCAATVRVTSLKDRTLYGGDALITIDEKVWDGLTDQQQEALIDHELEHLQIIVKDGQVQTDDLGRPKLKCRPHDWEVSGFQCIVERRGEDALEALEARNFMANYGPLFQWAANRKAVG